MHTVIDADQLVLLLPDCLDSLLRLHHQREHLRVLVRIVRLEIRLAYLPRAEQLLSVIGWIAELMDRDGLQLRCNSFPDLIISTLQIRLSIVRNNERNELPVPSEKSCDIGLGTVLFAEPLVMIPAQDIFLAEMLIDHTDIVLQQFRP